MLNYIKAFIIMLNAHRKQKDKAGKAYFLHPYRVSKNVKDKRAKIVALLHDVLEDSNKYTLDDFHFLDKQQKEALTLLTHKSYTDYFDYIRDLKDNEIAKTVKIEDLKDNMNIKRLNKITDEDLKRTRKYLDALTYLLES